MKQIVEAKLLFRLQTLTLLWCEGSVQKLPLNFLQKHTANFSAITSFKLIEPATIKLYFKAGKAVCIEPAQFYSVLNE